MLDTHFERAEFACKCGCGFDTVDAELLAILEDVRKHFGKPITVTSGCRCVHHNKTVNGAKQSQHIVGRAADFKVIGFLAQEVYDYLDPTHEGGLELYETFVHVDTRNYKARW